MLLWTRLLFCTAFLIGSTQRNHTEPWTFPAVGRVLISTLLPKSTKGEGVSVTLLFASHLWGTL